MLSAFVIRCYFESQQHITLTSEHQLLQALNIRNKWGGGARGLLQSQVTRTSHMNQQGSPPSVTLWVTSTDGKQSINKRLAGSAVKQRGESSSARLTLSPSCLKTSWLLLGFTSGVGKLGLLSPNDASATSATTCDRNTPHSGLKHTSDSAGYASLTVRDS